jgi:phosphatidylglycerol:prolipoprotein diacylglycerol transferase
VIPYFEQPTISLGPLTIHAFGAIVASSVLIGLEVGRRRFARLGIDAAAGERFAWYVVAGGFLGAHLFSLLFYFPAQFRTDPFALLRVWENLSSFGGMLGGLAGSALFFYRTRGTMTPREQWIYLDVLVFVFAISLMIGRVACTLAHDHPGTVTDLPIAISLASVEAQSYIRDVYAGVGRVAELPPLPQLAGLGFHDLGWYEFLYLGFVIVPVFWLRDRRPRAPGAFVLLFATLYMPARFAFDFLRVADARYADLTPAQWSAIVLLVVFIPLTVRAGRISSGDHEIKSR